MYGGLMRWAFLFEYVYATRAGAHAASLTVLRLGVRIVRGSWMVVGGEPTNLEEVNQG